MSTLFRLVVTNHTPDSPIVLLRQNITLLHQCEHIHVMIAHLIFTRTLLVLTDTKNVVVYQCKADYTGNEEGNELTINKGDHVNVLEKSDGGMCSDDRNTRTYTKCLHKYTLVRGSFNV